MNKAELRLMAYHMAGLDASQDFAFTTFDVFFKEGVNTVAGFRNWDWLHVRVNVDTTADQTEYDISTDWSISDFSAVDSIVQVGERRGKLQRISYDKYLNLYGDDPRSNDRLRAYYLRGDDTIGLLPTPSTSDSPGLVFSYYKQPTLLTSDSSEPEWHTNYHRILANFVASRMLETNEYYEEARRQMSEFRFALQEMSDFYDRQTDNDAFIYGDGFYAGKRTRREALTYNLPID